MRLESMYKYVFTSTSMLFTENESSTLNRGGCRGSFIRLEGAVNQRACLPRHTRRFAREMHAYPSHSRAVATRSRRSYADFG